VITVTLTPAELSYLMLLVSTEADLEYESQHLPDESAEERALTAMQKLFNANRAAGVQP